MTQFCLSTRPPLHAEIETNEMSLRNIFKIFLSHRSRTKSPITSTARDLIASPDPMTKYPHPENQELFAYLRSEWKLPHDELIYHTSPYYELVDLVNDLTNVGPVKRGLLYGRLIVANPRDLVFVWTQGMAYIFVKLRPEHHEAACRDGGRLDPTYPPNWVEFVAGGQRVPRMKRLQWRSVIYLWIQTSYDDSMNDPATPGTP